MQMKRRLMMAGATLFVAFAAGHVVQSGVPFVAAQLAQKPDPKPVAIVQLAAVADPAMILPDPSGPEHAAPILPAPERAPVAVTPAPLVAPQALADVADCSPRLNLAAKPGAMLGITLHAPCRTEERVVIRHAGLAVTGRTSASGALMATLPALVADADVSILFAGGETVTAALSVPEADQHRRFAVQWLAADAFQVHAFADGADYGTPGHISAADPQAPGAGNGFLTLLGDDQVDRPMLAEVFTFPAAGVSVEVVLEAAVTPGTCGREILGETLMVQSGEVVVTDLSLAIPGCEAVGEYLVLNNLAPDLKLAAAD